MESHLVSIIVPCYNQAQYLDYSLQSVVNQIYEDWECIIVNDGSPDNTEDIVKRWRQIDSRFKYLKKENGGLSSARNAGLEIALGNLILFLDADDFLAPEKLSLSVEEFQKNDNLDVVITNYNMFSDIIFPKSKPFYKLSAINFSFGTIVNEWDIYFAIPIHCGIFKKSSIGKIAFNENLKAKEDWLFWIQFFKRSSNFVFIDKQLVSYRKHIASMTQSATYLQENQDKALVYIKKELSSDEYEFFLLNRLKFYKYRYLENSSKYSILKNSLTYRFAFQLRRGIYKLGLLPMLKKVLQKLRK